MTVEKKELEYQYRYRKVNPPYYYASKNEVNNPKYRSASPATEKNRYGFYQNGSITALRSE